MVRILARVAALGAILLAAAWAPGAAAATTPPYVYTLAGGHRGFSGDGGFAWTARLRPTSVQPLPDGSLVILDAGNQRIRRMGRDGVVRTIAGTGRRGFGGDGGPATAASFRFDDSSHGLLARPDGSLLVADTGNARVRRIAPDGTITTVAGTGHAGYQGDGGPATAAQLDRPEDLTALPGGGYAVTAGIVRAVAPDGTVRSLFGRAPCTSGPAWVLRDLADVAGTAAGDTLVADERCLWRLGADGALTALAGNGDDYVLPAAGYDGPALDVGFAVNDRNAIAATADGGALVATEMTGAMAAAKTVRRITPAGRMTTVLGCDTGCVAPADGVAATRVTTTVSDVAELPGGSVAAIAGGRLLEIGADGLVHLPAPGVTGLYRMAVAPDGRIIATQACGADTFACAGPAGGGGRVVAIGADGAATVVAGGGTVTGDTPVATAALISPRDVAVAPDGRILILDAAGTVRRVEPGGELRTIIDLSTSSSSSGSPAALATRRDGSVVVATGGRLLTFGPDGATDSLPTGVQPGPQAPRTRRFTTLDAAGDVVIAEYDQGPGVLRTILVPPAGPWRSSVIKVGDSWKEELPIGLAPWDGTVMATFLGRFYRLDAGGRLRRVAREVGTGFFGTDDGTPLRGIESPWTEDLVPLGRHDLLVVDRERIRLIAAAGTTRAALAITRGSLRTAARRRIVVRVTRPGVVRVVARDRRGRVAARAVARVGRGQSTTPSLPVRHSGAYRVVATLTTAGGARAGDEHALLLGGVLPKRIALREIRDSEHLAAARAADDDPIDETAVRGCHRIDRRRVDCWAENAVGSTWSGIEDHTCYIVAARLARDGVVRLRRYGDLSTKPADRACPAMSRRFDATPRWTTSRWWQAVPLTEP